MASAISPSASLDQELRAAELYFEQRTRTDRWTDHLFAVLFVVEWIAEIGTALWISPRTWTGQESQIHPHVWVAVFLGGLIVSLPLTLAITNPGRTCTRLTIALAQGLSTAVLIHLTGGRIETHFSVFVSLALLAFYRDWRVLLIMAAVVAADHFVRGMFWPQSVYGVSVISPWRFLEHSGWVALEVVFLLALCRQGLIEAWSVASRQAQLEAKNKETELAVAQLREEVLERERAQRELEQAKDAAEAANYAKSEFLANMSHELRTPLNAVIGFADVLSERVFGPLNDNQSQYVQDILESGQHLLSLVNDVLDLAKIEAGSFELQRTLVSLPQAIERTVQMFRERAIRHGLRLVGQVSPEIDLVDIDERRVKQLLYNLLSNALKFTPEGGEVRVSAERHGDELRLCVSDTGIGIAPDQQEKIFESFYQVDSTLTKNVAGTGLGLAVVRKIAELHQGTVHVESEPGLGSTFVVMLPVIHCETPAEAGLASMTPSG
ncbi:MAG TPA: HAMP domain-containing sensor histidine kinase [Pirellulales bacterium]|nr:HAMP domain-containing sensor histidine kinase [Pirellulales bacterium]